MAILTTEEKDRVRRNTSPEVNSSIDQETNVRLLQYKYQGASKEEIARRISQLEKEWDIERTLEANAASFSLLGLVMARVHSRKWLWLSTGVAGFLLQHAVQGWCPPLPLFRRMGIRTQGEIEREKYALKALRDGIK